MRLYCIENYNITLKYWNITTMPMNFDASKLILSLMDITRYDIFSFSSRKTFMITCICGNWSSHKLMDEIG